MDIESKRYRIRSQFGEQRLTDKKTGETRTIKVRLDASFLAKITEAQFDREMRDAWTEAR